MVKLSNTGEPCAMKVARTVRGRTVGKVPTHSVGNSLAVYPTERTRRALRIVDAMQPAVLFIDEIEKGLSGATSSGQSDSGVSTRMLGSLLSWLNDHTSDVFVVCTANDISKLPPELIRAERFDGLFFLDLPGDDQKQAIWNIYREQYGLTEDQKLPEDRHWTGSEIRACCRQAALLDVPLAQAAENVVPVAVTAAESVARLRRWASNRCLSAEQSGVFVHGERAGARAQRNLSRDPRKN